MISLEQIRLLEDKISKTLEMVGALKEENAALRKGIDSAQRRMRELEGLIESFKADQKEIEDIIVRALKNLDSLENGFAARAPSAAPKIETTAKAGLGAPSAHARTEAMAADDAPTAEAPREMSMKSDAPKADPPKEAGGGDEGKAKKGELDIFLIGVRAMPKQSFSVDILGVSFTIQSGESSEYMRRLTQYLAGRVAEVRGRYSFEDPLKVALLACLNIADDLFKERGGKRSEEHAEIQRITENLLRRLDENLDGNVPYGVRDGDSSSWDKLNPLDSLDFRTGMPLGSR